MKKLFCIFLTFLYCLVLFSQTTKEKPIPDIAQIKTSFPILNYTTIFIDSNRLADINIIKEQKFIPLVQSGFYKSVPAKLMKYDFYYQFTLQNSSNEVDTVFLNPGYLIDKLKMYVTTSASNAVEAVRTTNRDGFIMFSLEPNITKTFFVQMTLARTGFITLKPEIIHKNYLHKHQIICYNQEEYLKAFSYILSGILLLMLLFAAANYIVSNKKEFLHYCFYTLCMLCLVFLKAAFRKKISSFSVFFVSYFDFVLLTAGTIFYIAFTRFFLDTRRKYKTLDKLFKIEEWILASLLIGFTVIHYFTNNFWLELMIENSLKFIALALGIVYIIIALYKKEKYAIYLAYGNAAMIVFSIISLTLIWHTNKGNGLFSSPLFYYNIGLAGSLIFFLFGLTYKNTNELIARAKRAEAMKQQVEKNEIKNQLVIMQAQQEERNRISADMHDDLGAGITSIRLYSELAKNKIGKNSIPEIDRISSSASELLSKMNAIIWSMSSTYDNMDNLMAYIRSYALEYFENTGIECHIIFPDTLPRLKVRGEMRRNIFLVVKEALNNILKHSRASKVEIILKHQADILVLNIHDNGTGIDLNNIKQFGNGLRNMKKRMKSVGVDFNVENKNGTLITLSRKIYL